MHILRATRYRPKLNTLPCFPPPPPLSPLLPHHLLQSLEEFLIKQDCLQEAEQRHLLLGR